MYLRFPCLAVVTVLCAITQEPPEAVFKVDTTIRQIDAVVTDKQGRIITDLNAADFEILEGRKTHAAEYCSYIPLTGTDAPSRSGDGRLLQHQLRRTFVFVISNPRVTVDLDAARGAELRAALLTAAGRAAYDSVALLEHFVRNRMQPGDLVAVLRVDQNTGVLAQLTNDRDALIRAVAEMRNNPLSVGSGRVELRLNRRTAIRQPDFQDLMQQNLRAVRLVSAATDQIAALPGRKAIILVARFMMSNHPRMLEGQIVGRTIAEVTARANKAGVTIHTVSLAALSATRVPSVADSTDALFAMASQTGGTMISEANDIAAGLDSILELNRGYYLLGYRPSERATGVKVRLKRAGLRVYARTAGIAPGVLAGSKALTSEDAMVEAFASPLALDDLPLRVDVSPVAPLPRGGKTSLQYDLKIDLSPVQLGLQVTGRPGFSLEITVGLYGPDGKSVEFDSSIHHFQIVDGDEQSFQRQMTRPYHVEVDKPGEYEIRALVRDTRTNRAGTAARFIEVKSAGKR